MERQQTGPVVNMHVDEWHMLHKVKSQNACMSVNFSDVAQDRTDNSTVGQSNNTVCGRGSRWKKVDVLMAELET